MRSPGCCTTSATSTSTTRSSPRTSRRRDAEWDEIASHAERGARILARCGFGEIAIWVRHHHERIDGEGYPDGFAGDAIPLESRILHVADAYEAMTRGHSYQPRMTAEAAMAELERLSGTQFDPQCVAALRRDDRRARARPPEPLRPGAQASIGMWPGSAATRAIHARMPG